MSDIVFEDLPPARTNAGKQLHSLRVWKQRLDPLRARPGEWAVVLVTTVRGGSVTASQLRQGTLGAGVDTSEFEFASRVVDNEGRVYARFVGGAA